MTHGAQPPRHRVLVDNRPPVPVTVPELSFLKKGPPLDNEPERREVADRFAEYRTVARGRRTHGQQSTGGKSFKGWKAIGAALANR